MLKGIVKPLLYGTVAGSLACLLALLMLAWAAVVWSIPHAYVVPLGVAAAVLGAWFGGFTGAAVAGRNGWMIGLMVALILFLVSVIAGIGIFRSVSATFMLLKCLCMLACGMLGGIMAVNTRKRNTRRAH